jgi:regulator of protease activity HflC (stomatin/prohibitin superfamily)
VIQAGGVDPAPASYAARTLEFLRQWLDGVWEDHRHEFIYAGLAVISALVRAMGKTVESGNTGLKFSFGRATREVGPGFYPLIPFLQIIRTLPTRSRTLDLPAQRVTTDDGLVFEADANLVYRVVDVRRALIEIDDLERGMLQVLGLSVQELLRHRSRGALYASAELDGELSARMAERLAAWGVEVEHAGFPSLRPSLETTRVTQLASLGAERRLVLDQLTARGVSLDSSLALLGSPVRFVTRTKHLAARHRELSRLRRTAFLLREAQARMRAERLAARKREGFFMRRAREERERKRLEAKGHKGVQPAAAPAR